MFLITALIWFIAAIVYIALFAFAGGSPGNLVLGLFGFIAIIICFMSAMFVKKTVLDAIDQGRFHDAKNDTLFWIIMGIFGFGLPSILLVLTFVKLGDALVAHAPPGYMPYAPGTVVAQTPPQGQAPPPANVHPAAAPSQPQAQQAPQYHPHQQTPMYRCKNCSVQYPTFMHSCPNCGAPKA